MSKKIVILFTLISFSNVFSEEKSATYSLGKDLVDGFSDGLSDKIQNSDLESVESFIEKTGKATLNASSKIIDSKEFNNFSKDTGNAIAKVMVGGSKGIESGSIESSKIFKSTMNQSSKELASGMNDVFNNFGSQMQDTFKEGGEFQKGMYQAFKTTVLNNAKALTYLTLAGSGAYFTLQYGIPFAFKMLERYVTRPKLIIESSTKTFYEMIFGKKVDRKEMIFPPVIEERLNEITQVTSVIQSKIKAGKKNVKYRNLLLYGPPGTGKTLFATELAKRSGLEYVCMSGSSFSKFKDGEGIEALDELFAWANKSEGLLIFIDEAETFLMKRENMDPQSKGYLLLNNFLNYTGTRSDKFMIVFATNHKDVLDSAMYRRIDDLVEMPLPGQNERVRILMKSITIVYS